MVGIMNKLVWGIAGVFFCTTGLAQVFNSDGSPSPIKKPKPISREFSLGFRLNSDGWSLYADKGYVRSNEGKLQDQFYNIRLFQLELSEHKDPKETKRSDNDGSIGGNGEKAKAFIYGKVNNFYSAKLGYGFRKLLVGKPEPGTVSIHWLIAGGFSLGMEKPYYLDGYVLQDNGTTKVPATFKYSDDTKQSFLTPSLIKGSAGWTKGLGEMQYIPGIQAKTGLHFDFAASRRTVLAIETGISLEYYSRDIVIMADQETHPYLVNLFASFQFGRRK